jgi:hypothetical protein
MLDFLGFIVTAALMVLAVNAVITVMDVSRCSSCHGHLSRQCWFHFG